MLMSMVVIVAVVVVVVTPMVMLMRRIELAVGYFQPVVVMFVERQPVQTLPNQRDAAVERQQRAGY
jgi:hypothetical protein